MEDKDWQDPQEVLCLNCLHRPSRPGSVYCSAICRVLAVMRRFGLALVWSALVGLAVGCASSTPAPSPTPRPTPARVVSCAWYTVTDQTHGRQVVLSATGPACQSKALIDQVAGWTRRTWITEGLALVPHSPDDLFSQVGRAGSVVRVWFTGQDLPTLSTAGTLSDALQAAGWTPQLPQA